MVLRFRPPKPNQKILPVKPTKGHFLFAHQEFKRVPWWKRKNMRTLYIYIVILILTNTANGFDGSMMNGLQTLSYWQEYFNHPHGSLLGLFNASMSLGSLLGLFVVPYMIDAWGRRLGCFVGCLIMLLAVGLQSGATGFGMFIAARLLIGFGDCLVLGSAPLLIAEIAHPQDRAVLVTLSGASYHSGAFIASWVTLGTLKIQEIDQTRWVDFLKTKGNRKRIGLITALGLFSQWSGNGLISYYLKQVMDSVGITKASTQLGINAGIKTEALVTNFTLAFFIDRLGRRPVYLVSTVGTFVVFNAWTIVSARYAITANQALGYVFVVLTVLYGVFYDIKFGLMATYTTEILPYGLRAKGFTWLNFCYYIVYCVFLGMEVFVIYTFLIETRYTPMEEIAKYFDGDDAVDVGQIAVADMKEQARESEGKAATVHVEVKE
ncbi:major facilitator superfamily domain-containing protein [Aspergillus pseudocaelatus]|uniref:Major facilitator superfamily domain-containing protein n=1 Tax=Aspergillus pseudocaelatus TaxID=1825620 RepID=A0ABQ6X0I3_9EURO|nr:major facilitator superfamily domain-containing protein [Aspergillus pseudocaelatus]